MTSTHTFQKIASTRKRKQKPSFYTSLVAQNQQESLQATSALNVEVMNLLSFSTLIWVGFIVVRFEGGGTPKTR